MRFTVAGAVKVFADRSICQGIARSRSFLVSAAAGCWDEEKYSYCICLVIYLAETSAKFSTSDRYFRQRRGGLVRLRHAGAPMSDQTFRDRFNFARTLAPATIQGHRPAC